MSDQPRDLLVFRLDAGLYALEASLLRRILWLPELSPLPEALPGIVGRFNLHGEIIPVTDLALHLGREPHRLAASDQVMVLDLDGSALAVVASEVRDLARPFSEQFLPDPGERPAGRLVTGTLQLGDDLVTLLDARQLARPAGLEAPPAQPAIPAEQSLLRSRAQALREAAAAGERSSLNLAVVELEGQLFGIDLEAVQEFCRVPETCPLPCCPPHIAGVFNLRGRLVTLLEISSAFDLPSPAAPRPQAVIARLDGETVGVAVDGVIDVFNPQVSDLQPVPETFVQKHGVELRAIADFAGRRVLVLDFAGLLKLDRWVVDETTA